MRENFIVKRTLPQAYHAALDDLAAFGDKVNCPDYNTTQREMSTTMVIREPLAEPMISRLFIGDAKALEQYRQEMLDGILDFEIERGNWAYTYHARMTNWGKEQRDQVQFVIDELRRNPDSRRAVIDVRDNDNDMYADDPACLQHLQYFIRDNALHCKVLFRSNDACKATFMNAFALIMLQKRIADALGVAVGTYTHRANSFHVYERDERLLKGYRMQIHSRPPDELCYDYNGEWDELMDEAKPEIAAMVEQLKEERQSR